MELQFQKNICKCLRRNVWQTQQQEQTLEVRLPDGMPEIGSILTTWAQPVLRGKQWRGDGMSVSGGVMAWVLYNPEDGSEPRSVEAWLPFQLKWSFPDSQREGTIRTSMLVRSVDARPLSSRKMMVRATVSVLGEALEPWEESYSSPEQVPEDVQLLKKRYPVRLPKESGEKTFLIDEDLPLPSGSVAPEKLICGSLLPRITEQKVLGGKVVFRGNGELHLVYRGEDGKLHSCDMEAPFSQYADLDQDYDKDAEVHTMTAVTNFEPEIAEGGIRLKCGVAAQYLIFERCMLELVEDAYSTKGPLSVKMEGLSMPALLDITTEWLAAEASVPAEGGQVVDTVFYPEQPTVRRAGELTEIEIPGLIQVLYYDNNGKLRGENARWNGLWELGAGENASVLPVVAGAEPPQAVSGADQILVRTNVTTEAMTAGEGVMPMVTGLEMGEAQKSDPNRPSLILRRAGEDSLWDIAKSCRSTMDAIRQANHLSEEPGEDQMLLIPVS